MTAFVIFAVFAVPATIILYACCVAGARSDERDQQVMQRIENGDRFAPFHSATDSDGGPQSAS